MTQHVGEIGRKIPSFVATCIDYILEHGLDIEGIFRLSGHAAEIEKAKAKINLGLFNCSLFLIHVLFLFLFF